MKNRTETVKMNRKINCLNKTIKRTETDPKLKTESEPKPNHQTETNLSVLVGFYFHKNRTVFLNFGSEPIRNRTKPNRCPPLVTKIFENKMILAVLIFFK